MKIMLSAGEVSGDLHGARLAQAILVQAPETELVGFGGREMAQAGVTLAADFASYNVMGVWEVLKNLGRIRRLLQRLTDFMREERPDLLVLIDYPDFNWRLAARARKLGIPVFSYIPPSAWAWRKGRAKACAKLAEEFVAIFPHELPVYEAAGAKISFVGNPLVDTVRAEIPEQEARQHFALPEDAGQKALLELIDALNQRPEIDGILCQLPLPKHLNEESILLRIDPKKDVDAFHPYNVGRIMIGNQKFLPCTPAGVMELIRRSGIDCTGKECVVVGRSNIVGKPMAMLLLQANGTVTVCHSRTKDLSEVTRRADILVVAIGKADFITGDMVKEGAVVIDVGMNRRADGKLTGDVDFATVAPKASYITPVPGGVGPMTITMLMQNTLTAATEAARA